MRANRQFDSASDLANSRVVCLSPIALWNKGALIVSLRMSPEIAAANSKTQGRVHDGGRQLEIRAESQADAKESTHGREYQLQITHVPERPRVE